MFSIIMPTRRDFEAIKPIFNVSSPDAEIIIIDTNYNDKAKQQLKTIDNEYYKVTYVAPFKLKEKGDETKYKRDLVRCHNTGFAIAENDWIIKVDDCTEFRPDFFDKIKEDIKTFKNTVIRPVKLESWSGDTKWNQYHILRRMNKNERYIELGRNGLGNNMFITLDQAIFPRDAIDDLNGNDERFDIGHGWEDNNLMQRFITYGYKILLDQQLMTFQISHSKKLDPIDFSKLLFQITQIEVQHGKYHAYNPYGIKKVREKLLPLKHIHEVKKITMISGTHPVAYSGEGDLPPLVEEFIPKIDSDTPGLVDSGTSVTSMGFIDPDAGKSGWHPGKFVDFYPFNKFFSKEALEENKKKILGLKNKHKGEDLFILGNSPDITKEFIDKIRDKTTFASNAFIVCKDAWDYEPTYMIATNQGVFDNHLRNIRPEFTIDGKSVEGGSVSEIFWKAKKSKFILSDLILKPLLLDARFNQCLRPKERMQFLDENIHIRVLNEEEMKPPFMPTRMVKPEEICFDIEKGTYTCSTVILDLMIPVAAYMGFKNIYLKGCSGGGGHFYDTAPRHFWDEKHQKEIYELYGMFRQKLNSIDLGINIYNLDSELPHSEADFLSFKASNEPNPTEHDGHRWNGTPYATRRVLGKLPWFIEYKNLEDVL